MAQTGMEKKKNKYKTEKNFVKNVVTFFGLQKSLIMLYNPVGIYSEKTGYMHKWHKLYFTQQQRTEIVMRCIKIFPKL
jgi:hypothetical protein